MGEKSANTQSTGKRAAPRTAWKKGVSGNPKGRPKVGTSMSEIFKELLEKYPEENAEFFGKGTVIGKAFLQFPPGVQMKYLLGGRVLISLMNEPTPGLLKESWDRIEGKVTLPVKNLGEMPVLVFTDDAEKTER